MTINLISTQHSLHHGQVEWDALSKIISQFAYFDENKQHLIGKIFLNQIDELEVELNQIERYLQEFKDEFRPVISQLFSRLPSDTSLEQFEKHLSKEGVLNFFELNKLTLLMESALFIKQNLPSFSLSEFKQINLLDFQPFQKKYLREFRFLVETNGEVHFEKHPELAEISKKLRELEERIRRTVQEWISQPQHAKILQYSSYDVHYDRFVVPVRSDSYRSDLGLIVSRSESGSTLFIEPFEVREACNKRLELIAKIDEIINQLALKFSRQLAEFSPLVSEVRRLIIRIDFYLAKAEFVTKYDLNRPRISSTPGFNFFQIFHPLLEDPIKNNAQCGHLDHGIVISGPNTGGKTVFLKSLSLAYLLFYHGFFVPASDAQMYPYKGLFYFGNDLQDLKSGLSSFSGEVKNYVELLENIHESNLILIDEIFNSTSSDEASALSLAYFDELHRRGLCHIVVSTHHQMFKTMIHQDKKYLSCHVGFDTESMKPTYKIIWGTPGSSMALEIFKILTRHHDRLQSVPVNAALHLNSKNISYESLLQKVTQKEIELDKSLSAAKRLEADLKNQKGSMEGILNLRLNEEIAKAKRDLDKILNEARSLVEEARKNELVKLKKIDDREYQLKREIAKLNNYHPDEEVQTQSDIDISTLKPGDTVFSLLMKKEFTVQSIDLRRNEVIIAKGTIKLNAPATSLTYSKRSPAPPKVSVSFRKDSHAKTDHDVRGMRLSEFERLLDQALGDLLTGDIPFLNIIHGHGDGVLKKWLRDYLKNHPDFICEFSENGNDGVTRVILNL
jgi:DNA mismatch repair protein MutS2